MICQFGLSLLIEGSLAVRRDSRKGERKMKLKQRLLTSLALAAVLAVLPVGSSYAAELEAPQAEAGVSAQTGGEEGIDPQYVNAANITADLVISGNNAHVYASAIAKRICHVTVTMRLQRKEGSSWQTKVSWVGSSNTGDKTLGENYTLTQRGTYRTYAIFNVGGEELTYTSVSQVY